MIKNILICLESKLSKNYNKNVNFNNLMNQCNLNKNELKKFLKKHDLYVKKDFCKKINDQELKNDIMKHDNDNNIYNIYDKYCYCINYLELFEIIN